METIYVALGTNLGNRLENIQKALAMLPPYVTPEQYSYLYETEPHQVEGDQPRYYNMVVRGNTELSPQDLLAHLKSIEKHMGREDDTHNKPRPIDLDILLYGELTHETPELVIPHPRLHERAFVLAPLAEIAPLVVHPKLNVVIAELEERLGDYTDAVWLADERL